jgi:hypothetical protein
MAEEINKQSKQDEQDGQGWEEERTMAFLRSELTSFFDEQFKKNGLDPATRPADK